MEQLNELLQWCISNKAWLTVNYSPFSDGYKVFVNPGRSMTSAKWFKTLDDAVRACWVALGVTTLDKIKIADHMVQKHIKAAEEVGHQIVVNEVNSILSEWSGGKKRRGRPKGSKNKPKVVANE